MAVRSLNVAEQGSVDPNLLVGIGNLDDAGVYRIGRDRALVQTVDFITPLVDDPFTFGEIAAANALSDIYAMGGRPLTALNIACFPCGLEREVLDAILAGGLSVIREAGATLVGGHTITDQEIKYGLAATGMVDPAKLWTNAGTRPGDALILTKPLGTGIIATAIKQQKAPPQAMQAAIASMRTLNRAAMHAARRLDVHAATDVTGFGLLGHAMQLARASTVTIVIDAHRLPLLPSVSALAETGLTTGGAERNREYVAPHVAFDAALDSQTTHILLDPQTSGGLLLALAPDAAARYVARLGPAASIIGHVEPADPHGPLVLARG